MTGRVRRAWRIAKLLAALILCLIPHLVWKLLPWHSPWPRRFLGLAARSAGARVTTDGQSLRKDVFFIANHISWIDILALGGATGTAFISHDGVAGWPIVGWLAKQNNTIFVARANRHGVRDQIRMLHEALASHQPIALFPEGTTSDGYSLLPFKPALLAGLMPPPRDLQIQPVWIDYGPATPEIAWHGDEAAGANAARVLAREGALPLTLHFLEPFDPEDFPDRKAVAEEARNRIMARQSASLSSRAAV
ncbi:MAG: 1-acyl-sn-glycerol-3-phosphate acyltransferase [Sphingobium sp.]|nr:1-acyl-sn-glycerol-3-phosphate acyltransferase [Sphingobium sp.]MCP5397711.1 1-acyl-sn-glycerol-3-phosphate acyltransferase [Sphingomonas sp.]